MAGEGFWLVCHPSRPETVRMYAASSEFGQQEKEGEEFDPDLLVLVAVRQVGPRAQNS